MIEVAEIAHRSGGWVGDWLALSSPAFPRSSTLGSEAHATVLPSPFLSKNPLLQCAVILSLIDESFISDRVSHLAQI